ncbi:MAG TPA: MT-A70 family methyltransferase [Thermoanaerobaculia bacterium]|nr:MT-A70 family methyltransferase [Thermoanaerobaculia bacterium]
MIEPTQEGFWGHLEPPYRTIVADPPWRYASAATKADARKHYSTMGLADICAMPVAALADESAHLWLWGTNALMYEAHLVCRAWGFRPLTVVTWCKAGPGVGHYLRNNTEHVILASKGKPATPKEKPLSTWFQWEAGQHSAKPGAFFDLVERVSVGPFVEIFARQPRLGWDHWGKGFESRIANVEPRLAEVAMEASS